MNEEPILEADYSQLELRVLATMLVPFPTDGRTDMSPEELKVLLSLLVRGHMAQATEGTRPTKEELDRAIDLRDSNRRDYETVRNVMAQAFLSIARVFLPKEQRAGQDVGAIREWIEESVNNGVLEEEMLPVFARMEQAPNYVHVMTLEMTLTDILSMKVEAADEPAAALAYQYCARKLTKLIEEAKGKKS